MQTFPAGQRLGKMEKFESLKLSRAELPSVLWSGETEA